MFPCLLPEATIERVEPELTSGSLREKYEGKSQQSHSNSPRTNMSSGCSSRETFGLLEHTAHIRLADFSLTEGI